VKELAKLVYTVEEVDLDSLEKHITVWKVDLNESQGSGSGWKILLVQRLMREYALLMKTLRAYFTDDEGIRGFQNIQRERCHSLPGS
jgi:hypothetical protein